MREKELEYLRNELNQRLSFSYEHTNKLIGHILLVWGGALTILSIGTETGGYINIEQRLFIIATIFFISVVVIFLLSHRNSENMIQFSKIAAYIAIFYEKVPHYREHGRLSWELAMSIVNKKEMGKTWLRKQWNKFGNEYFWLSFMATVIIVGVSSWMIGSHDFCEKSSCPNDTGIFSFWEFMFGGCIFYMVISLFLSIVILYKHLSLNWEKWNDKEKEYLRSFLEYAIKNKRYRVEDIKDMYGEDFYDEIVNKRLKKVLEEVTVPYYERES